MYRRLVVPNGYIYGLTLSNNATDPNNDIDIAAGVCRSFQDTFNMTLGSTLVKRLDAAWAVGTNQGGLFSGTKTLSTAYHVFLIRRTSDGTIDAGYDTSYTAANIPSGWVAYRRLGTVYTDASNNLVQFYQVGNYFWFKTPVANVNSVSQTTSFSTRTITAPPGKNTLVTIFARHVTGTTISTADNYLMIREVDSLNDVSGITIPSPGFWWAAQDESTLLGGPGIGFRQNVVANSSAQISTRMSEETANIFISTIGYWDDL